MEAFLIGLGFILVGVLITYIIGLIPNFVMAKEQYPKNFRNRIIRGFINILLITAFVLIVILIYLLGDKALNLLGG